jgi:hypothetical protein
VTVNGVLFLLGDVRVRIEGGTTFTTAHLIGGSSGLLFAPGSVLSGTILFEGPSTGGRFVTTNGLSGTLTIGPTGSIRTAPAFGGDATIGQVAGISGNLTLVNQGTISSQTAGFSIGPNGGFSNEGTLEVHGGGRMIVGGAAGQPEHGYPERDRQPPEPHRHKHGKQSGAGGGVRPDA